MTAVYEKQYGKKPIIEVTHAGLECGLFAGKIKNFVPFLPVRICGMFTRSTSIYPFLPQNVPILIFAMC